MKILYIKPCGCCKHREVYILPCLYWEILKLRISKLRISLQHQTKTKNDKSINAELKEIEKQDTENQRSLVLSYDNLKLFMR